MRALPISALLALACATPLQAADPLPQRLSGLWEVNVTPAGQPGAVRSFHVCVGSTDPDVLAHVDDFGGQCEPLQAQRAAGQVQLHGICRNGTASATRSALFSGDFSYNYQGDLSIRYDPPREGVAERRFSVDGRRLAPCKALKPGEVVLKGANGRNLNLGQ
jgi:hypothetical protein